MNIKRNEKRPFFWAENQHKKTKRMMKEIKRRNETKKNEAS